MNRIKSSLLMLSALMGSLFLSSCDMGDGTNKFSEVGIFTVENDGSGYILYRDYGGVIHPAAGSVNDLTSGKGFQNGDRVYLVYSYTDDNIKTLTGKGTYIDQVELIQGQNIPIENILFKEKAEADKLLEKDSVFSFLNNVTKLQFGIYRGFLTASFDARYSVISNKGIYPNLYLIYDPAENERPNTLKLTAVYNRHSPADAQTSSQSFVTSYPLSSFANIIQGSDSIEVTVDGLGFSKPLTTKMGREDLNKGNYRYFK